MNPGSVLVLAARSGPLLHQLKEELQSSEEKDALTVHCVAVDLATEEGVDEVVRVARQEADCDFDHVLLVNNAGEASAADSEKTVIDCHPEPFPSSLTAASLGEISKFSSFTNLEKLNAYMSLNVNSAVALTAGMLQAFPCRPDLRWMVVNVSSTFALNPAEKWGLYCTAKVARKMMFSILAEEEPSVKVLSYSPGKDLSF